MANYKTLGVMLDCSRNSVILPERVKEYATTIAKMGYNALMLYTEDTYEIEGQPYFGYLRGRYTRDELRDMDAYCQSIGVELIPCIQTLAHLPQMFKWRDVYEDIRDCDDILLMRNEKTYSLISAMLKTCAECFTSRRIHIGMDEAYMVGKGKFEQENGYVDRFDALNEHLHRVCEMAANYGFETMVWSDMFTKLAAGQGGGGDQYEEIDASAILEKADLPENVSLVYWDYYSESKEKYDMMIKRNRLFGKKVYFGGAAWVWEAMTPHITLSMRRTSYALDACIENGVEDIFMTVWGDDGNECPIQCTYPMLMFAAEKLKGNTDMDDIKARFFEIVGVPFDSFMAIEELDTLGGEHNNSRSPSKYLLYNDVFSGILDYIVSEEDNEHYAGVAKRLREIEVGDLGYVFEPYVKLADVLSVKAALGVKTRVAYLMGDKEALGRLLEDYDVASERVGELHRSFRCRWLRDNKPQGFEIQDIRLGGLIMRLQSAKDRLVDYIEGRVDSIPELEEELLPPGGMRWPLWREVVTASIVSHSDAIFV